MIYFPYFSHVEMLSSDVDLFYINFLLKKKNVFGEVTEIFNILKFYSSVSEYFCSFLKNDVFNKKFI